MTKIHTGYHLKYSWILNSSRCSAVCEGHRCGFLSFIHACRLRVEGHVRAATLFWCLDERRENKASPAQAAGFWEPNERAHCWTHVCLDFKWWSNRKKCPSSPTPASVHTCTAISRLINCESRSLETLNHSFSVLSRAASLAALTRGSTLFTQHRRWRRQTWWARGFTVVGVATHRRGRHPIWTMRNGVET